MTSFDLAIIKIKQRLQLYFPTVLTTIVTDYFSPSFEKTEIEYDEEMEELREIPPPDAMWDLDRVRINFYRVDGSSVGSLLLPGEGNELSFRLVITKSKLYILQSVEIVDIRCWQILTFEAKGNKVVLTDTTTNRWTSVDDSYRADNYQLTVVNRTFNYYYICRSSFHRQVINFDMQLLDVSRLNDHYFVLGLKEKKRVVAIYRYDGRDKPVLEYSFQLQTIYTPKLITVTDNYIIVLTTGSMQSWIELHTHGGHFLTRTSGPVMWNFQEGLRTNGKHLLIDTSEGCSLFQQSWPVDK